MGILGTNEFGELGEGVIREGIEVGESISGFVADGGEAELAEVEDMIEKGSLLKADVFDVFEGDDVEGLGEEGSGGVLDEAAVGDE